MSISTLHPDKVALSHKFCAQNNITDYWVGPNGIIDVNGIVDLRGFDGTILPVQFGKVKYDFLIQDGHTLTSLRGSPHSVGGDFYCYTTKITSLEYAPHTIGGSIYCHGTNIKSLSGIDKIIKHVGDCFLCDESTHMLGLLLIKGVKRIRMSGGGRSELLTHIFNKYVGTGDILSAQDEMIDAGLIDQARL